MGPFVNDRLIETILIDCMKTRNELFSRWLSSVVCKLIFKGVFKQTRKNNDSKKSRVKFRTCVMSELLSINYLNNHDGIRYRKDNPIGTSETITKG